LIDPVGVLPGLRAIGGVKQRPDGDDERVYRLYLPICGIEALELQAGLDGLLAIGKYLLQKRGRFAHCRMLTPNAWHLDDETAREIDRLSPC